MSETALRTLIVDDEPIARARLQALCREIADAVRVVGEASNGVEALARIRVDQPDLVLLDIAMPDLDGLQVAAALAEMNAPPEVVFCTAYPSHALEAFEVAAVDYLLKPINRERFAQAVGKAARLRACDAPPLPRSSDWLDHLWVPHREAMIRIDIRDVNRIEAEGDYVRLVTPQASYLLHETMAHLEERLDPDRFSRIRRSMIVRTDLLGTAVHLGSGVWNVSLTDGPLVRVGPTYWKALKSKLKSGPG